MGAKQIIFTSLVLLLVGVDQMCNGEYQDLSWVMDMNHISYHPVYAAPKYQFTYTIQQKGGFGNISFVAFNSYSTVEHMGTHVDAPYHFDPNGKFMDQVPLQDLIGPLVRIDITEKAKHDPQAGVLVEDLTDWEEKYGPIPKKSFVLMYSGWDQYYGNQDRYIGPNGHSRYPGFSEEASKWLIHNRDISGLGVDSLSCDIGEDVTIYPVHHVILYAGKICIENLRNLDKVPASGSRLAVLPIMMKNGTGTQARVFAEWGTDMTTTYAKATTLQLSVLTGFIAICMTLHVNF